MVLPETPRNIDAGMFMVSLQMIYQNGLNHSQRILGPYSERPACTSPYLALLNLNTC